MLERTIEGFSLTLTTAVCPQCDTVFSTELITSIPALADADIVEADLHRVFPHSALRASLLALCPNCHYCSWNASFKPQASIIRPEFVIQEVAIQDSKKYALAVKCARETNTNALDVAYLALNGLWCAREAGEVDNLWLELTAYEHARGMTELPSNPNENGIAHLLMGELWRQFKKFKKAKEEYELTLQDPGILAEIVRHQIILCQKEISTPTALPPHIVCQLFPTDKVEETKDLKLQQEASDLAVLKTSNPIINVQMQASDNTDRANGSTFIDNTSRLTSEQNKTVQPSSFDPIADADNEYSSRKNATTINTASSSISPESKLNETIRNELSNEPVENISQQTSPAITAQATESKPIKPADDDAYVNTVNNDVNDTVQSLINSLPALEIKDLELHQPALKQTKRTKQNRQLPKQNENMQVENKQTQQTQPQVQDASDAIAKVENYFSFSQALRTGKWFSR